MGQTNKKFRTTYFVVEEFSTNKRGAEIRRVVSKSYLDLSHAETEKFLLSEEARREGRAVRFDIATYTRD